MGGDQNGVSQLDQAVYLLSRQAQPGAEHVEHILYLAVRCHVAASTRNQVLSALLFLYRHVLEQE